jgi:hypothetical protein
MIPMFVPRLGDDKCIKRAQIVKRIVFNEIHWHPSAMTVRSVRLPDRNMAVEAAAKALEATRDTARIEDAVKK